MGHRNVLLIAYHFPPIQGSSGVQRTLRFAQHLPKFGWRPIVLTIDPIAYEATAGSEGNEIPDGLDVRRAFGLDTSRHLSIRGRYPRALAVPDRWATWRYWAVGKALRIIREEHVEALWSTFPIATAHQIACNVARRAALPWVAEFRDPMWQGDYPPDPELNRKWRELEANVFSEATRVIVTTPSAVAMYEERFPSTIPSKVALIENGFDEEVFLRAERLADGVIHSKAVESRPLTLLHSGVIYPSERDPSQLFMAISNLRQTGAISADTLQLILRASGDDSVYRTQVAALRIADIIRFEPPIDYLHALHEMLSVDGLLLLQASNCNAQIPAKLYEYLRAKRPILALTDPAGDTARTLAALGVGPVARLDSAHEIETALLDFITNVKRGRAFIPSEMRVRGFSRQAQSATLAKILDQASLSNRRQV